MSDQNLLTGGQDTTQTGGEQQQPGGKPQGDTTQQPQGGQPNAQPQGGDKGQQPNGDGKQDDQQQPVVPEKYEIKLPEGVALDDEIFGEFSEYAKGKKLTQEDVQQHVDFAVKLQQKWLGAQQEAWKKVTEQWVTEAKNDPDFGGAKFNENLAAANQLLTAIGEPGLVDDLAQTGMANNPRLFRALVKLSKHVTPDKFVTGAAPVAGEKSLAERMYPGLPKKG